MQESPDIYFIFLYKIILTNRIIIKITKSKSNTFILQHDNSKIHTLYL